MVSLILRDPGTGAEIDVTVPDLSGELFRLQWANRKATRSYAEFAAESCGVLLLIHPADLQRAPRIPLPPTTEPPLSTDMESPLGDPIGETAMGMSATEPKEWSPDVVPTQVELVELIQFVAHLHTATQPLRVAVVVSAWDLVRDPILPVSWVESHLPLLSQFLVANADVVPFRAYGVSALGGDLAKDLERLQKEAVPSHRIKVVENSLEPHGDLTAPIKFLLALDNDRPKSA